MKLDPVYLLAPKPKPPSMPTRRAALIAGATFLAGAGLGSACGYAAGSSPAAAAENQEAEWLAPTGDAQLDELRRLAIKAPDDELWSKRNIFMDMLFTTYPNDTAAWSGVERLAKRSMVEPPGEQRRIFATWLCQRIQQGPPERTHGLQHYVPILRNLR